MQPHLNPLAGTAPALPPMPTPNQNAYDHANVNARFLRPSDWTPPGWAHRGTETETPPAAVANPATIPGFQPPPTFALPFQAPAFTPPANFAMRLPPPFDFGSFAPWQRPVVPPAVDVLRALLASGYLRF